MHRRVFKPMFSVKLLLAQTHQLMFVGWKHISSKTEETTGGRLTQADVGGFGQGGAGFVGPQAVLLPQPVPLVQRQDDRRAVVPVPLAVPLHAVEQLRAFSSVALHNSFTNTHFQV